MPSKILILNNIRSAHNVGSLFRTADGAGVREVLLGGYTPTPTDRFGRVDPEILKTSLGATESVSWEHIEALGDIVSYLLSLKEEGWEVVVVEQTPEAVSLYDFCPQEKTVYILGNEIDGVQSELIAVSDKVVFIPMHGKKESLNVSVAGGIALFWKR